jgi:hypothetical protein
MDTPIKFPIGILDIDREILFHVPDKELYAICVMNKYLQICCNEIFWRNRFINKFKTDLGKYADKPYAKLYKKLIPLSDQELLDVSIEKGYLPLFILLVEENINNHYHYKYKLIKAAAHGHLDIVKYLINKGTNFYTLENSSLRFATQNGHLKVVQYLV